MGMKGCCNLQLFKKWVARSTLSRNYFDAVSTKKLRHMPARLGCISYLKEKK